MVVENIDGTELRFKNPGRLLLVVIAFIFWGVGFIDLIGHKSADPSVFGLYSLPFFAFVLLYGLTIVIWIALFVNADLLTRLSSSIKSLQSNTWTALGVIAGLGAAFWVVFEWDRWSRLPGLQFSAFGLLVLAAGIFLLTSWRGSQSLQPWRQWISYPLLALFLLEAIVQLIAWFGLLPGTHTIGGDFVPYERIYHNAEGFRNGFANRYGWYYPDFSLDDEKKRILIVGGGYVQALQVLPEEQIGALLTDLVLQHQAEGDREVEFIAIGLPGFGVSPFLFEELLNELPNLMRIDEMIVLVHLGDDFQSPPSSPDPIMYTVGASGEVTVHPDNARLRHDLTHYYLRGLLSFQLVETIRSNYLTPKVIAGLMDQNPAKGATASTSTGDDLFNIPRERGIVTAKYTLTEPGHAGIKSTDLLSLPRGSNFIFEQESSAEALEAIVIAGALLQSAQEIANAKGITLRVVTMPVFPEAFYNTFPPDDWGPEIGGYDLFLPERALVEIASEQNIQILPIGQYLLVDGMTSEEIQNLFFAEGRGHLTPQGHSYMANAIYACFFSEAPESKCSK